MRGRIRIPRFTLIAARLRTEIFRASIIAVLRRRKVHSNSIHQQIIELGPHCSHISVAHCSHDAGTLHRSERTGIRPFPVSVALEHLS
jgi:hypothetical protein